MSRARTFEINHDYDAIHKSLGEFIEKEFAGRISIEILEAGCGRKWALNIEKVPFRLIGIDQDAAALENRKNVIRDLDEVLVGDLKSAQFAEQQFDVIYSSFVLEHVSGAAEVLDNFRQWLKPGGLMILKFPDKHSVFGFLTRMTPHWMHVAWKKYVQGVPNAGKPGFDPYPTFYDAVVSRKGMHEYCHDNGLTIEVEVGSSFWLQRFSPVTRVLIRFAMSLLRLLSLGRLAADYSGLTYVLRRAR